MNFHSLILFAAMMWSAIALGDTSQTLSSVIDPDSGAYGIAFGSTEKQIVDKLGAPTGTVQLSSTRRALLYGKNHAFILRKGAFRTLVVVDGVLDYRLSQGMEAHSVIDSINWTLGPGIKDGMSYAQVAKAIGRPASLGDYDLTYETSHSRIELQFAGMQGSRRDPEAFSLRGFVIDYEP